MSSPDASAAAATARRRGGEGARGDGKEEGRDLAEEPEERIDHPDGEVGAQGKLQRITHALLAKA